MAIWRNVYSGNRLGFPYTSRDNADEAAFYSDEKALYRICVREYPEVLPSSFLGYLSTRTQK